MPAAAGLIALTIDEGVATATLARSPVNAIDEAWIARLLEVVEAAEAHGVRALLIRSKERTFSAGADLALMRSRFDSEAGRARTFSSNHSVGSTPTSASRSASSSASSERSSTREPNRPRTSAVSQDVP